MEWSCLFFHSAKFSDFTVYSKMPNCRMHTAIVSTKNPRPIRTLFGSIRLLIFVHLPKKIFQNVLKTYRLCQDSNDNKGRPYWITWDLVRERDLAHNGINVSNLLMKFVDILTCEVRRNLYVFGSVFNPCILEYFLHNVKMFEWKL